MRLFTRQNVLLISYVLILILLIVRFLLLLFFYVVYDVVEVLFLEEILLNITLHVTASFV